MLLLLYLSKNSLLNELYKILEFANQTWESREYVYRDRRCFPVKIKVEELCEYLPESSRGWKFIIHSSRPGVHSLTQGVRERLTYFFSQYKFKRRKLHAQILMNSPCLGGACE